MFKIGDFSKLSQVSSKALRYYDNIGLLKPAHVDSFSGYRYYTVDQLPRLNRIVALKELGFSLDQITQLLDENLSLAQLQGMLRMKQAEIERQIADEQQRLLRVQARLQQIECENTSSAYDVVTRQVVPMTIASIRDRVPDYSHVGHLFHHLFAVLGKQQVQATGSPFVRYHDGEHREDDPDIEACMAIEASVIEHEHITVSKLPAVQIATTIHTGHYTTLSAAYGALMTWIAGNDYDIILPNREVYLRGPALNRSPETYVTEIQFPISKRANI
ncbi:MAG: GyrI-like domain-containing protein [Chloroflexota bacterium]